MIKPLLVDTDILIDYLRGLIPAVQFIKSRSNHIIISAVSVAELYAGVRDGKENDHLDEFMSIFPIMEVTTEIARIGGLYKRDYYISHGVGLADAIIAATAKVQKAGLRTLNTAHFPMLTDVEAPYEKD